MKTNTNVLPNLKSTTPEIQGFIRALKSENKRLQAQIFKLQAQYVSLQHRLVIAEKNQKQPLIIQGLTPSISKHS
jgi:hypothetical protein